MRVCVAALAAAAVMVLADAAFSATLAQRCVAAKLKATSKLASDLIGCRSKARLRGLPVDPECLTRAQIKHDRVFTLQDALGVCPTKANVPIAGAIVDEFVSDVDVDLSTPPKRFFVTSTSTNGNMGGLAGADAICAARALAGGLSGTYKAWLSDSSVSAASRLNHSPVAYRLVDGTMIANDWEDLTDGSLDAPPNVDEFGHSTGSVTIWTGTNGEGAAFAPHSCADWTSPSSDVIGVFGFSGYYDTPAWTLGYFDYCDALNRLYCLEQ